MILDLCTGEELPDVDAAIARMADNRLRRALQDADTARRQARNYQRVRPLPSYTPRTWLNARLGVTR